MNKKGNLRWVIFGILIGVAIFWFLNSPNFPPIQFGNTSGLPESKQLCPTADYGSGNKAPLILERDLYSLPVAKLIVNNLINKSVWKTESEVRSCYRGKYSQQNPNWIYCADLTLSRWDLSSSGTINYRWYTMVTAEWRPEATGTESLYVFNGFSCENGEKIVVKKGESKFYIKDSRDGTEINIAVSGDETPINLDY